MNSLNFLDSNVWLALCVSRHVHAERARRWFEGVGEEHFFYCRFTQLAVLRLLTTESVLGADTVTMAGAWRLLDSIQSDDRIALLSEPEGLERELRSHSKLTTRSPKVWADAYLLAFTSVAGLKLITFDRALNGRGVDVLML
jgi:toxin-antitoxin system PIN domain toxin